MQPETLGWNDHLARELDELADPTLEPARVAVEHRGHYELLTPEPRWAVPSGRLSADAADRLGLPVVGDWVAVRPDGDGAVIHRVLPRQSCLVRRQAGRAVAAQPIAANVDTVFVVTSANLDLNPRRVERYLAAVYDGGASPVVVINKADLCDDPDLYVDALGAVVAGVPVVAASALDGRGLELLAGHVGPGRTGAVVGSSGVGKSTLVNRLLGREALPVSSIRAGDDRGRHTSTRRELVVLPGGGVLIDTPGMRELGRWLDGDGLERVFAEVEQVAAACRFRDCGHDGEPGCAVAAALEEGTLSFERLAGYQKLQREQAWLARAHDPVEQARTKRRSKAIHKGMRVRRTLEPKLRK
jgi:ribosome biogenesis GTPase / thiamine phosphate phosphatase